MEGRCKWEGKVGRCKWEGVSVEGRWEGVSVEGRWESWLLSKGVNTWSANMGVLFLEQPLEPLTRLTAREVDGRPPLSTKAGLLVAVMEKVAEARCVVGGGVRMWRRGEDG